MKVVRGAHGYPMRAAHCRHEKTLRDAPGRPLYHAAMINGQPVSTRTLTLVLPEADWRALREAEPDAIAWLHARIRERLAAPEPPPLTGRHIPSAATADNWWGNDDY